MPLPADVVELMTGRSYHGVRTAVYRFFDPAGSLLYVGVTDNPTIRFAAHRGKANWWTRADPTNTTLSWYETREEAEAAELQAIVSERPEFNIVGKDGYRGGRRKAMLSEAQGVNVDRVVALFRQRQEIEAEYKQALAELISSDDVPIGYIASRLGVERKTVYRHLGRSMT
jgi:predicted GIY-YIG superfamily endonuclease